MIGRAGHVRGRWRSAFGTAIGVSVLGAGCVHGAAPRTPAGMLTLQVDTPAEIEEQERTTAGKTAAAASFASSENVGPVTCLSFSSDGSYVAVGSDDNLVVWDTTSGQVVRWVDVGDVSTCRFLSDRRLLSVKHGADVSIVDLDTGTRVPAVEGIDGPAAVSPDGSEVLVGSTQGSTIVVRSMLDTTKSVSLAWDGKRGDAVGFTPEGDRWASDDVIATIWDRSGAATKIALPPKGRVVGATSGRRLLVATDEGLVRVSASESTKVLDGSIAQRSIEVHGETFAVPAARGAERGVAVVRPGKAIAPCTAGVSPVVVGVDPTGARVALGTARGTVVLADADGCKSARTFGGLRAGVRGIDVKGEEFAILDDEGRVTLWSPASGIRASGRPFPARPDFAARADNVALRADGKWLSVSAGGVFGVTEHASTWPRGSRTSAFALDETKGVFAADWCTAPGAEIAASARDGVFLVSQEHGRATRVFSVPGATIVETAVAHASPRMLVRTTEGVSEIDLDTGRADQRGTFASELDPAGARDHVLAYAPDDRTWAVARRGVVEVRESGSSSVVRAIDLGGSANDDPSAVHVGGGLVWVGSKSGRLRGFRIADGASAFDEHAHGRVLAIRSFPSGALLVARPDRVEVRSEKGERQSEAVVLRDGRGARLGVDGVFEASSSASTALVLQDKAGKRIGPLGGAADFSIAELSLAPTSTGATDVSTVISSSSGAPKIAFDGFPLTTAQRDDGSYDVRFQLASGDGAEHELSVATPNHPGAIRKVRAISDMTMESLRSGKVRALVMANAAYPNESLTTTQDAERFSKLLASERGWRLGGTRVRTNLSGGEMKDALERFVKSGPDETLVIYYAGHGATENGEGFLVPIDHAANPSDRVSATALWKLLSRPDTRAKRIVVVVDACHGGAFSAPEAVKRDARANDRILFVVASSAGATARGGKSSFTQLFADAVEDAKTPPLDPQRRAVTIATAFHQTAIGLADQGPEMFGAVREVGGLPLLASTVKKVDPLVRSEAPKKGASIASVSVSLETRSVFAGESAVNGSRVLAVEVVMGADADALRLSLFSPPTETQRPRIERFVDVDRPYRKGGRYVVKWDVPGDLHGEQRLEVKGCTLGHGCDAPTIGARRIRLP